MAGAQDKPQEDAPQTEEVTIETESDPPPPQKQEEPAESEQQTETKSDDQDTDKQKEPAEQSADEEEIPAAEIDESDEVETAQIIREEVEAAVVGLSDDNPDKVGEYFETKRVISTLRKDLREYKSDHELADELEALNKKVKEIRDKIKTTDEIAILTEKIATLKERMDLLKEIIKMELMQLEQEEIKHDGRKLKIIPTLKEMKDEEQP